MLEHVTGITVFTYGHSFPAWPDRWAYMPRLAHLLDWDWRNCAMGGERSIDTAARVIGAGSPTRWTPRAAHAVLVDCATNDMFGSGMGGLPGYRNAMRAMLAYISLEGPLDDTDVTYSGVWQSEASGDRHRGSAKLGGVKVTAPAFKRPGKWAFGYAGIPTELGRGSVFSVNADGVRLGTLDCHASCRPSPSAPFGGTAPRNRGASAVIVEPHGAPEQFTLERLVDGGGPWLDWWGKIDENPRTAPLVILPTPVRSPAEAYALPGAQCTDAVVAAYGQALREVAAEVGPHCVVVDIDEGWDPPTMMRRGDPMHPNACGSAHIADAILDALGDVAWWPWTDLS